MPTHPTPRNTWSLVFAVALLTTPLAASNNFGPDWDGDSKEDAGNKPETAQKVKLGTTATVVRISGELKGEDEGNNLAGGLGDYQDMYAVIVKEPAEFVIHTLPPLGSAEFNSILTVYDYTGEPLLANDDADQGTTGSLIGDCSTDGQFCVTQPGLIYIAISGFNSRPVTGQGEDVFAWNQGSSTGIVGPSGAGPFEDWSGPGETGPYVIMLQSVGPIPLECAAENTSSCFEVHALPYCDTAGCCEAVCSIDFFCCEVTWDGVCVEQANLYCGGEDSLLHCGSKEAGSCQVPHENPFCADPICCAKVCSIQPTCCELFWDGECASIAQKVCDSPCNDDCPPDLNFDFVVAGADLTILLAQWGQPGCTDFNGDGITNGADITILLSAWGDACFD